MGVLYCNLDWLGIGGAIREHHGTMLRAFSFGRTVGVLRAFSKFAIQTLAVDINPSSL